MVTYRVPQPHSHVVTSGRLETSKHPFSKVGGSTRITRMSSQYVRVEIGANVGSGIDCDHPKEMAEGLPGGSALSSLLSGEDTPLGFAAAIASAGQVAGYVIRVGRGLRDQGVRETAVKFPYFLGGQLNADGFGQQGVGWRTSLAPPASRGVVFDQPPRPQCAQRIPRQLAACRVDLLIGDRPAGDREDPQQVDSAVIKTDQPSL